MKNNYKEKCTMLLKKCKRLENEADELYEEADEHMRNANELEWEECLTEAIRKENYAFGIKNALTELGFLLNN